MQIGVHFADVWIGEAKDAQDRAQLEQERDLLVRRTAVACTQGGWDESVRGCITSAKTRAAVSACEAKIVPPAPPKAAGSAAPETHVKKQKPLPPAH